LSSSILFYAAFLFPSKGFSFFEVLSSLFSAFTSAAFFFLLELAFVISMLASIFSSFYFPTLFLGGISSSMASLFEAAFLLFATDILFFSNTISSSVSSTTIFCSFFDFPFFYVTSFYSSF